jgi:hypothetical protein
MSTHYSIFFFSEEHALDNVIRTLVDMRNERVSLIGGELNISGLVGTTCESLSQSHRDVMLEEYGDYGMDVNWEIRGTYDRATDIFSVIETLYLCASCLLNRHPDSNLSLIRNGESFLLFNNQYNLIVSPVYLADINTIRSMFMKPYIIKQIVY